MILQSGIKCLCLSINVPEDEVCTRVEGILHNSPWMVRKKDFRGRLCAFFGIYSSCDVTGDAVPDTLAVDNC